jgi:flavin-dependent dehydrogenase
MGELAQDVIVVGGGPAGATVGALLAERGHRVLLLEREAFPRYHIGESLIPYTWFTLDRLGLVGTLRASPAPKKYSVQFVSITGQVSQPFYFFETIKHECSQTWQVLRSDFDAMLLDNARAKGVDVQQGVTVRDVILEGDRVVGVRADHRGGERGREHRAKVVVDATGRETLLARRFGWVDRDPDLNKIAIWSYFKGAKRDPGLDEGATTVAYVPHKGWFWYIPLHDDIVSVGIVAERDYLYRDGRDPEQIFAREASACAWIHDHVKQGTQAEPVRVTGEYSYYAREVGGDGFCLAGDAFAFLDPLFSSGVFLALKSGEFVADAIHPALEAGEPIAAEHFAAYRDAQRRAVRGFRQLVLAFYDETFSFREFLNAYPHLHSLVVDTLVGNVFVDLEPLDRALAEYRGRDAKATIDVTTA